MTVWILGLAGAMVMGGVGLRLAYRAWRQRRIASRRRIEAPNSHYSSAAVRDQEDRQRWEAIAVHRLHPLNREEVEQLLHRIDRDGVHSLTPRERLFLDNMTLPRTG